MFTIARFSETPDNYKMLGKGPWQGLATWPLGKYLARVIHQVTVRQISAALVF